MKNFLILSIIMISGFQLFAQDEYESELKSLSDNQEFQKIIKNYGGKSKEFDAKSMYYLGQAYYMIGDDANCLKFMKKSVDKDANDPAPYFIMGSTYNYMNQYKEAIPNFRKAITLKSDAKFYSGLGDSFYNLKQLDSANVNYQKATTQKECPDRPYLMVAQTFNESGDNVKALESYYTAKEKISSESDSYPNVLFNIGLMEYLKPDLDKAEAAYLDFSKRMPADYEVYAKLAQVYYGKKDYEKAKVYKDKLYQAQKEGLLKETHINDMFCYDQFDWNGYRIFVYERYQEGGSDLIYNKHLFYVLDENSNTLLRVQTEYSAISLELGGSKYMMCATKGDTHYNPGIGYNDDASYDDLKKSAIWMFEKYMK